MKKDSRFKLIEEVALVDISFNGRKIKVAGNLNLASALLLAGIDTFRKIPSGNSRAAFCMMGSCFDCLINVEGENRQACMTKIESGMQVNTIKADTSTKQHLRKS